MQGSAAERSVMCHCDECRNAVSMIGASQANSLSHLAFSKAAGGVFLPTAETTEMSTGAEMPPEHKEKALEAWDC